MGLRVCRQGSVAAGFSRRPFESTSCSSTVEQRGIVTMKRVAAVVAMVLLGSSAVFAQQMYSPGPGYYGYGQAAPPAYGQPQYAQPQPYRQPYAQQPYQQAYPQQGYSQQQPYGQPPYRSPYPLQQPAYGQGYGQGKIGGASCEEKE